MKPAAELLTLILPVLDALDNARRIEECSYIVHELRSILGNLEHRLAAFDGIGLPWALADAVRDVRRTIEEKLIPACQEHRDTIAGELGIALAELGAVDDLDPGPEPAAEYIPPAADAPGEYSVRTYGSDTADGQVIEDLQSAGACGATCAPASGSVAWRYCTRERHHAGEHSWALPIASRQQEL